MASKHRTVVGTIVLLIVVLIWVASSEVTRILFVNEHYNKPFFTTYLKTSMFSFYLLGFVLCRSWRKQCTSHNQIYQAVSTVNDDNASQNNSEEVQVHVDPNALSAPVFEPVKFDSSSDSEINTTRYDRAVRFDSLSEVRHMSESTAREASLARLSYSAYLRAQSKLQPKDADCDCTCCSVCFLAAQNNDEEDIAAAAALAVEHDRLPVRQVAKWALFFCVLWFIGNYSYQLALNYTTAGVVNVLSSSSSIFTLILAAMLPSASDAENHRRQHNLDRLTLSKAMAVLLSVVGVLVICWSDLHNNHSQSLQFGVLWALVGAVAYACYLVLLRRSVTQAEQLNLPMFFGFVGTFNAVLLWPGFFILSGLQVETFRLPSNATDWSLLIGNGAVGTVLSELLWLWGCFLTSSLVATLSLSLTIPLTMLADYILSNKVYHWSFYIGSLPIFLSFLAVAWLNHANNADPLLNGLRWCWRYCFVFRRHRPLYNPMTRDGTEQSQRLILNDEQDTTSWSSSEDESEIQKRPDLIIAHKVTT